MTTGERLVDISTLSTGTALEHFTNISTGGGSTEYIFTPSDELQGLIELDEIQGTVQELELIKGTVTNPELQGTINDSEIVGEIINEQITGNAD